jgi:Chaperone for flagella basal body P-ring formation
MKRLKYLLSWFLVGAALPALAASGRYAISADRVVGAMAAMGMQVSSSQLSMISEAVATTAEPQLRVQSMQRWPGDRIVVRMECATQEQCLPFFVSVQLGAHAASQLAMANAALTTQRNISAPPAMAVRAGSPATLYIEGDHIHIRVNVICRQSGAIGQTVRAESTDRQQTYTAEVAANGVLKGRL